MKIKKKLCSGCNELQYIWKNHEGNKYCKNCWFKIKPNKINKKSKKKEKEDKEYEVLRKVYLESNKFCKVNYPGCTKLSTEIHHIEGRGKNYLNIKTWVAICRNCHDYIHFVNPKLAREEGWLK